MKKSNKECNPYVDKFAPHLIHNSWSHLVVHGKYPNNCWASQPVSLACESTCKYRKLYPVVPLSKYN